MPFSPHFPLFPSRRVVAPSPPPPLQPLAAMGAAFSKPRLPRHVQDSVVLNDGLPPLADPKYAATSDGRFVFVLGNERIASVDCDTVNVFDAQFDDQLAVTFDLDVIDLFLSKRTRLGSIGDIYGAGLHSGFYALDESTVVIVDFPGPPDDILCQRVVRIDMKKQKAEYVFRRAYALSGPMDAELTGTFVDKDIVATISEGVTPKTGYVFPANPLSSNTLQEISHLFERADAYLEARYDDGTRLANHLPPFFFSDNKMGCFIYIPESDGCDTTSLIEIDTGSGSISLRDFPPGLFTTPDAHAMPFQSWSDGGREVIFYSRFELTGPSWHTALAERIPLLIDYAQAASNLWWMPLRLSRICEGMVVDWLEGVYEWLLTPRYHNFVRAGILDVKTMQWTDVKATLNHDQDPYLVSLNGGHFVSATAVMKGEAASRNIGNHSSIVTGQERIELIRNPSRLSSLTHLATLAVQRSGRVGSEQLEQIVARLA